MNQKTEQNFRVMPMAAWDACAGKIDIGQFLGRPCYGGLDLASTEDLASFSLAFAGEPEAEMVGGVPPTLRSDRVAVFTWSWCPEEKIQWRASRRVPYDQWARNGWLTATGGNQIDYRAIREFILGLAGKVEIREIAFDGWNAAQITQDLAETGLEMVKIPPHVAHLSGPTKEFLRRVKGRTLVHPGSPLTRWAASNLAVEFMGRVPDEADMAQHLEKAPVMPSKKHSADKIDPITSIVLAFNRLIAHPESEGESVYSSRGLTTL
jgi:phage terminase large subunit-like protein